MAVAGGWHLALWACAVLGASVCLPAWAATPACDAVRPDAVVQRFQSQHADFYFQATPGLKQAVTPALWSALRNHYRCAEREGLCHLDYDPWLGAQDGDMAGSPRFQVTQQTADRARVDMHFQLSLGPSQPLQARRVTLVLAAMAPPACWRVDDLITPLGDSLAQRYRQPN